MVFKGFRFGMLLQFTIGPVCIFIFQTAASSGFAAALAGVAGVALADALFITAAILGIGAIIERYPKGQRLMKYFGAAVLIIFGIGTAASALGISVIPSMRFTTSQGTGSVFLKALLLTLSSPLTILFWAGVFSSKITEENMPPSDMYLFGSGAVLSTLFFLSLVSFIGSLVISFVDPQVISVLNLFVGLLLVAFGLRTLLNKTSGGTTV